VQSAAPPSTVTRMRSLALAVVSLALASSAAAQASRVARGVVRDSAAGTPLGGALVELRSSSERRVDRTDEEGGFRIAGLPAGRYQLSVLRIGFREARGELEIGARDTVMVVAMAPVPQRLDAFRVRGDISAIYGMVGSLPDLLPVAGVRVQVIGANKDQVTDSTGGFFIPVDPPGIYMVRMTRDGYAERMLTIDVPRGRAVDASRLLDPGQAPAKGLDVLYKDLDQRIRQRAAASSALVPGSEIRRAGNTVIAALQASPSFNARGFRFADSVCVFVNGIPRAGVTPDAFMPEEIESVEVYGVAAGNSGGARSLAGPRVRGEARAIGFSVGGSGDRSGTLGDRWPPMAPCGSNNSRTLAPISRRPQGPMQSGTVKFVVIWLRK
jgi:hypothetical protein